MTDAYQATLDPRMAPQGDALAAQGANDPLSGLIAQEQRLMGEQTRNQQQREAAMAPLQAQAAQITRQPLPTPPTPQATPPAPQRNQPGADEAWLMAAMVLGAIGGGLTRQHVTNGLAAMTGALEGYNQGNTQRFEQELKKWSEEGKAARAANQEANTRYQQILESRKLALDQKLMEIQLTAAKYDDRAAMQLAQTRNLDAIGRLMIQRDEAASRTAQAAAQLKIQRDNYDLQREKFEYQKAGNLTPEDAKLAAGAAMQGSWDLFNKYGRGTQGPANLKMMTDALVEMGATPELLAAAKAKMAGMTSEARAVGTMAGNVGMIFRNAEAAIPAALAASDALPRGTFVPLNRLMQTAEANISDPRLKDFKIKNLQLAELWARAMNPRGVMRESDRTMALDLLSTADSPETYRRVVTNLKQFLDREKGVTQGMLGEITGPQQSGTAPPQAPPASAQGSKTSTGVQWSIE